MQFANKDEIKEWLARRGIPIPPDQLAHAQPEFTFAIPTDAGKKTALARLLLGLLDGEKDAMLYIDEWGIFPSCEDTELFETFRKTLGTTRPLIEVPGHIFDSTEFRKAQSLVGMVLYFFWGGLIVTGSGRLTIRLSHDEWLGLAGTSPEVGRAHEQLVRFFSPKGGTPTTG